MEQIAQTGLRAGFHCEDPQILAQALAGVRAAGEDSFAGFLRSRPVEAEVRAVSGVLAAARQTGAKTHICHVSHPDAAALIRRAQEEGLDVTAETCAHYLIFDERDLLTRGAAFKCAPPLRDAAAREALWGFVLDGTLGCVASDHSPAPESWRDAQRRGALAAWCGLSGVQTTLQVMADAVLRRGESPALLARVLAKGPAQAFGLWGKKGALEPGFDADCALLDPEAPWTIREESLRYMVRKSAFCGLSGKGLPVMTILRGQIVCDHGSFTAQAGCGRAL